MAELAVYLASFAVALSGIALWHVERMLRAMVRLAEATRHVTQLLEEWREAL